MSGEQHSGTNASTRRTRFKFSQLNLDAFTRNGDEKYWIIWRIFHRLYFPFVVSIDTWACSKLILNLLDGPTTLTEQALPVIYMLLIFLRLYLDW